MGAGAGSTQAAPDYARGGGGGFSQHHHHHQHADPFELFREFFGGRDPFANFFGVCAPTCG